MIGERAAGPVSLPVKSNYIEADIDTEDHDKGVHFVPMNEMEKRMIAGALERFEGNRRRAARALKIS